MRLTVLNGINRAPERSTAQRYPRQTALVWKIRAIALGTAILLVGFITACTPPTLPGTITIPTNTPLQPSETAPTEEAAFTSVPTAGAASPTSTQKAEATPIKEAYLPSVTQLPDAAGYEWRPVIEGLDRPIGVANAGDGSGRLFLLEQAGEVRVIKGGVLLAEPFLDIRDRVGSNGSERGLLGIAFHPNYRRNGYFYVNYTDLSGNTVIARFHADPTADKADPGSEKDLLRVKQPFANHNGGEMVFGPDGYLYIGLGDGGSQGDPFGNGQSLQVLLGKILRIDVDHGDPYSIPADNPFASGGGKPEIWAYGLRNPWRFSFDQATADLYIADVGQDQWEEIDFLPAGSPGGTNFGWSYREGKHPYKGTPPAGLNLADPIYEYSHAEGCAVIGGEVYRGQELTAWEGVYVFGDFCSGRIWGLLHMPDGSWQSNRLFDSGISVTSFGLSEDGELYLTDYAGSLDKLAAK